MFSNIGCGLTMKRCKYFRIFLIFVVCSLFSVNASVAAVKVAFIADQGTSKNAKRVLQLIAAENAELLLIQGDLGYKRKAATKWVANLNEILGPDFPILAVVGNHENFEWNLYKRVLKERINRIPKLSCDGDIGVKALCTYDVLSVVQVAPGINEVIGVQAKDKYPQFILDSFNGNPSKWRICSWHKNQTLMQIGGKRNETGWGVYEACLSSGAIVATGHAHSYSRTHLLSSFEFQTVVHTNNHLELVEGQSFAFVNGLGGKKVRNQKTDGDWWAARYSRTQHAKHGALFCSFEETTADCYFKSISEGDLRNSDIPDMFTLESMVGGLTLPVQ